MSRVKFNPAKFHKGKEAAAAWAAEMRELLARVRRSESAKRTAKSNPSARARIIMTAAKKSLYMCKSDTTTDNNE